MLHGSGGGGGGGETGTNGQLELTPVIRSSHGTTIKIKIVRLTMYVKIFERLFSSGGILTRSTDTANGNDGPISKVSTRCHSGHTFGPIDWNEPTRKVSIRTIEYPRC